MISPAFTWETWEELEKRNRLHVEQARNITLRTCAIPDEALRQFEEGQHNFWEDSKDAFLNDTARIFGMGRSTVENEAVAGRILWRESREVHGTYQAQHSGRVETMTLCRWNINGQTFADRVKQIQQMAANQP